MKLDCGKGKLNFARFGWFFNFTSKHIRMKKLVVLLVFAACSAGLFAQKEISGITLPAAIKAGNETLMLNGGGTRVKFFIDVYVCGLYLPSKSADANAVIKAGNAEAVRIVITSKLVSSDKMAEAVTEGFEKSMGGNTASLKNEINKFVSIFKREPIVKGDVFDLIYNPAEGVRVLKNNKQQDVIAGAAFKQALLGIWLGNDPVDKDLKAGMLGK